MPRWPSDIDSVVKESFAPPDPMPQAVTREQLIALQLRAQRRKLLVTILLLLISGTLVGVGAALHWDLGAGLLACGLWATIPAVLLGLST